MIILRNISILSLLHLCTTNNIPETSMVLYCTHNILPLCLLWPYATKGKFYTLMRYYQSFPLRLHIFVPFPLCFLSFDHIANLIANNIDTPVDLSGYSSGSYYTTPSDGYLRSYAAASSSIIFRIYGASGSSFVYNQTENNRNVTFMRKGMRVEVRAKSGTCELEFIPFKA